MFDILDGLSGGLSGGGSGAATSNGPLTPEVSNSNSVAGNTVGGLTINKGFRFDPENPVHVIVGGAVVVFVGGLILKRVKQ